jgi:formate C-acetyltransferase
MMNGLEERFMDENKQTAPTGSRVARLREKLRATLPEICIERGYLMTQSYKETEAYPQIIRRAKALEKVLGEMTILIDDDELIVGNAISKMRGGPVTPEINWGNSREQIEAPSSNTDEFAPIPAEYIARMKDVYTYWQGRALFDKLRARVPDNILTAHYRSQLPAGSAIANNNIGSHMCVDYPRLLAKGFNAIKIEVDEKLSKLDLTEPGNTGKYEFYTAVGITLQAAVSYAKRYANRARELAGREKDPRRASELSRIAEICDWVPANPARNFYEALQFVWLTHVVLLIEGWGPGMAFGRADQYLYPFYKKDVDSGAMTREQAREMIGCFCIKINQPGTRFSFETVKTAGGLSVLSNITLGGITIDGKDAVNELSYVFLEAQEDVNLAADEVVIRVNKTTPDSFLLRACEAAKKLKGKFKFICDETAIAQLMYDGKLLEDARDYIVSGCALPTVPGVSLDIIGGQFNLPLMLELALNNGKSRITGEQIGVETGDPKKFKTYDDIWGAYKKQVEYFLPVVVLVRNTDRKLFADYLPTPFQSAGFQSCIDRGVDITNGGTAPYITDGVSVVGAPNVADSLAAIKKVVFEDKKIPFSRLVEAIDKDFEGEHEILNLVTKAPKYGNDDDYVDSIMIDIFEDFGKALALYKGADNSKYAVGAYVAAGNLMMGAVVGALPDGRRSGAPLCEGGLSPYPGRNVSGSTSTINSVTKLDIVKMSAGAAFNMKFNPSALKDATNMRKFASLIRTYFDKGGFHVQFNIVSTEMLKEAQKLPEKYRDLLVRVATYSAFFTDLGPECQQEIIDRIEFQEI